jgi:cyclophilin family peptidyl-prolyl cis-trans isomerase
MIPALDSDLEENVKNTALAAAVALIAFACAAPTATETATTDTTATAVAETATPEPTPTPTPEEKPMSSYENKIAEIHTGKGVITVRFYPDKAPNHVRNFIDLAEQGFYNGTKFHRIIPGFMIQGGDPNTKTADTSTWGMGGSGKNVKAEFNDIHHKRGILSMARSQHPDSASSQFFVTVADAGFLDNNYTVFGEVLSGMEVADQIVNAPRGAQDRPNDPVAIERVVIRDAKDSEKGAGK